MRKTFLASARRVALGAALASPLMAQAAANDPGLHVVLSAGLTTGGDTILTAYYDDGDSTNVKAGALVHFGGGVLWQAPDLPLATSLTINYHADNASARNGEAKFSRIPIEAIAYYTGVPRWRFGAGVRVVQSPEAKYDVGATKETLKFDNASGALVEVGYALAPDAWLNLRYVSEKYQPSSFRSGGQTYDLRNADAIDGSHFGLNLLVQF